MYIIPLDLGDITMDKSELTLRRGFGTKYNGKMIAYYIGGAEAKVLVDTGTPDLKRSREYHPYVDLRLSEEQTIERQLSKVGVKPSDIDMVVLTHLHWDHCFGLERFKNAEFIVQKREYYFALDPIPPLYVAYEHLAIGLRPAFLDTAFTTLAGEKEIAKGIRVFPTPGHSPGSQSVAVETAEGTYVIAGDTVMCYENIQGDPKAKQPYFLPGIYTDMLETWESMDRIYKIAGAPGRVLPGHEAKVFEKQRYP